MRSKLVLNKKYTKKRVVKEGDLEVLIRISSDDKRALEVQHSKVNGKLEPAMKAEEKAESPKDALKSKTLEIPLFQPVFGEPESVSESIRFQIVTPKGRSPQNWVSLVKYQPLMPTPVEITEVLDKSVLLETNLGRALKLVCNNLPELEFKSPEEISEVDVSLLLPKVDRTSSELLMFIFIPKVSFPLSISEITNKRLTNECLARTTETPADLGSSDVMVEFDDPLKMLFGSVGIKQVSERPLILFAEKPKDEQLEYIEFLKRVLKEIYRTRVGGLPVSTHLSTKFDEVKLDVKAGKSIYVIDIDEIEDINERYFKYLSDRIRELFSQNFGFVVFYGSESKLEKIEGVWRPIIIGNKAEFSRLPKYSKIKLSERESAFTLANFFWGVIETPSDIRGVVLDEYVLKLEEEFYDKIEEIAGDLKSVLIVEPSGENEEGLEGESIVHYGVKAFVVKYLTEKEGIPLEDITTELDLGDAVIDVYVRHPKFGDVAVEVETLYGTAIPLLKLRKRIESRLKKGLRSWIVIPNPQFIIYFKEISALRNLYRKKYNDLIEFYTLDIKFNKLVSFREVAKSLRALLKKTDIL